MIRFASKLDATSLTASPAQVTKLRNMLTKFKQAYNEAVKLKEELGDNPTIRNLTEVPYNSKIRDWGENLGYSEPTLGTTRTIYYVAKKGGEASKAKAEEALQFLAKDLAEVNKYIKSMKALKPRLAVLTELSNLWTAVRDRYDTSTASRWDSIAYRGYGRVDMAQLRAAGLNYDELEEYTQTHAAAEDRRLINNALYFIFNEPNISAQIGKKTKPELQSLLKSLKQTFPGGSDSKVQKAIKNAQKVAIAYYEEQKAKYDRG